MNLNRLLFVVACVLFLVAFILVLISEGNARLIQELTLAGFASLAGGHAL